MPGYDPASGISYGEWLRSKGVGYNPSGRSRTERVINEGHLSDGQRFQVRENEVGDRVRERSTSMGVSTGQDVTVKAPALAMSFAATERWDA